MYLYLNKTVTWLVGTQIGYVLTTLLGIGTLKVKPFPRKIFWQNVGIGRGGLQRNFLMGEVLYYISLISLSREKFFFFYYSLSYI